MATKIKLLRGTGVTVEAPFTPAVVDGQLIFDTAKKAIYLDTDASTRIKLYDSLDQALTDIASLKTLVGSESVATQIANAIATLKAEVVTNVAANDNSVVVAVADLPDGAGKEAKVNVKLSTKDGNQLSIATESGKEGLYVPASEAADTYEIEKAADSGNYAAIYSLMRKPNGTGTAVKAGVDINIPKDMVVQSGEVVEVTAAEAGATGYPAAAGTYIKLVLQNVTDPLWINVGDLIEYVTGDTAADGMITVAVDATTHVATATINDGKITLAKLHADVQTSLGKANSAVQPSEFAMAKEDNKYIAGFTVTDGTITPIKETLPDISALDWGTF